jgi:hypothetical protein
MISVYRAFEECHSNNERKNNKFRENGEKNQKNSILISQTI